MPSNSKSSYEDMNSPKEEFKWSAAEKIIMKKQSGMAMKNMLPWCGRCWCCWHRWSCPCLRCCCQSHSGHHRCHWSCSSPRCCYHQSLWCPRQSCSCHNHHCRWSCSRYRHHCSCLILMTISWWWSDIFLGKVCRLVLLNRLASLSSFPLYSRLSPL